MKLRDVAHGRAGDKGRLVNLSVIAFDERDFSWLVDVVTVERARDHLGLLVGNDVRRYLVPGIGAINFVATRPVGQSVTRSLALDAHGKSLSSALLEMELPARPERLAAHQ